MSGDGINEAGVPEELREKDQWICWRTECRRCGKRLEPTTKYCPKCGEKSTKRPVQAGSGGFAKSTGPETWGSMEAAIEYHGGDSDTDGIGFVFDPDGLVAGVDLDGCRDPETGEIDDWAAEVVESLDSFTEVSPSGTGLHIYVLGFVPDGGNRNDDVGIEMYDSGRYFTVTGHHYDGTPTSVEQRQDALKTVHADFVADDEDDAEGGEDVEPPGSVDLEDAELIKKACNAENGEQFERLWNGDTSMHDDDHSRADLALLCHLAFWTGGDRARMERLFEQSGLVRGKWRDRKDYRDRTIDAALSNTSEFYDPSTSAGRAAADGGATVDPNPQPPEPSQPARLKPGAVISRAGYDPEETDLSDLKASEAAFAIDRILEDMDAWNFLVVDDETEDIYSFDDMAGVWKRDGERRLKQVCRQAMGKENSKTIHGEVVYSIQGNPNIQLARDDLGAPAGTIATPNGLLDLRERESRPLRPEHHALNRIDTEYNPEADYEDSRWIEFLRNSVKASDLKKVQEYAGYCLWHHAQPFGKALFLVGPTDSGKGTFLKAISQVIGDDNIANESLYDLLQTRWGPASLFGNMLNVRNEVTPRGLKNIQKFKEMTGGGDKMSAEHKGKDKFEFRVTQKFMFSTNQMPEVENGDGAFYNRLLFAVFPETVPEEEQDKDLLDKLDDEREAILNWMLDGLDRLMKQTRFTNERSREDKETIMQEHGDAIGRFVTNVLEVTGDADDIVHKGDLYEIFTRFNDYIDRDPVVQQTMTTGLKELEGISDGQSRKVEGEKSRPRVFMGIRVKPEALKELQAEEPRHSYSDEDDGADPSDQQRLS